MTTVRPSQALGDATNSYGPFYGSIDEFRIWSVALSGSTIGAWYNKIADSGHPNFANLFTNWHLDEGSGTTASDASGNSHNGTLVGLPTWIISDITINSPEINIKDDGIGIVDCANSPAFLDDTNFGIASVYTPIAKTFTIENKGTSILNVTTISMSGANASSFSIGGISLPATIPINSSTTFTVTFNATGVNVYNARVDITNTDCDESAYDYAVKAATVCGSSDFTGYATINTQTQMNSFITSVGCKFTKVNGNLT